MNTKFTTLLFIIVLLFSACQKDKEIIDEPTTPNSNNSTTENLNVPDGFVYNTMKEVIWDLSFLDSNDNKAADVLVNIIAISEETGSSEQMYSGMSNSHGAVKTTMNIPIHFSSLVLQTTYEGITKQKEFDIQDVISATQVVDSFANNGAESRSNNCYPDMSASFGLDKTAIYATQKIDKVTLHYLDGTKKLYKNDTESNYYYAQAEICDDGIDNDGDGLVDCADPKCAGNANCDDTFPCAEGLFQLVGGNLKQLNPVTGVYVTLGTLPSAYKSYNGSGYNAKDGYIYCIGKSKADNKFDFVRINNKVEVRNMGDLNNYEGPHYTGDFDGDGNWRNIYYKDGEWRLAKIDVSASPVSFTSEPMVDHGVGSIGYADLVYNKTCNKIYVLSTDGTKMLAVDIDSPTPSVEVIKTYTGMPAGTYGAAWADQDGSLYFGHNSTGNIYQIKMDADCNPSEPSHIFTGTATNSNDGMSCPNAPAPDFGGTDTDGDGMSDLAEEAACTNPNDPCHPYAGSAACVTDNYGFYAKNESATNDIAYAEIKFACDAPIPYTYVYNDTADNDLDDDGVPNATDPDPLDPNKIFVQSRPSANSFATLAFEDLWPQKGDYDFNDFVIQIKENIITNRENQVHELRLDFRIMAMGGYYNNDFGISLPNPNANVEVVVNAPMGVSHEQRDHPGEKIIIINKPKNLLGIPTDNVVNAMTSDSYIEPIEFQVVVDVKGCYNYPEGYTPKFFLEGNGINGHEIHLSGVAPTPSMKDGIFGTVDDDTNNGTGKYYQSAENLPWALYIPIAWDHPIEGTDLLDAYIEFQNYVENNPSIPWYLDDVQYRNNNRIYKK